MSTGEEVRLLFRLLLNWLREKIEVSKGRGISHPGLSSEKEFDVMESG